MSMEVGMESVPMWKRPVEALSSEGVKELHRLQAENVKLRELARKLAWCAVVTDCGACDGACEDGDEWPAGCAICTAVDHMMRELGIEV